MNRTIFAAAALVLLGTAANAGTIVNDPGFDTAFQVDFFEPLGQSFTAIDAQLLTIGFRFGQINPGFPNDLVKLDLYTGTGTGGTLVASRTLTLPTNVDYSFFTDIDFTGTSLTVGAVYSAALSIVGNSPLIGVVVDTDNEYAGGVLFSPQASLAECGDGNCDLAFRVVGTNVPEPASWALLITGFGLTGATLRAGRARRAATA